MYIVSGTNYLFHTSQPFSQPAQPTNPAKAAKAASPTQPRQPPNHQHPATTPNNQPSSHQGGAVFLTQRKLLKPGSGHSSPPAL